MVKTWLLFTLVALGAIGPWSAGAQVDPCARRTVPLSFAVPPGVSSTQVPVADLQAKMLGKPLKLLSLVPDDRPHRIVMVLDGSGSMRAVWEKEIKIAAGLAAIKTPNTEMALYFFGSRNTKKIDFSKGQPAVSAWLDLLLSDVQKSKSLAYGPSAIYDSVLAGLNFIEAPTSADALFLLSDGEDNSSRKKWKEFAPLIESSGIRLFFVELPEDEGNARIERIVEKHVRSTLVDLARKTGGDTIEPYPPQSLRKNEKLPAAAEEINAFYAEMIFNHRLEVELFAPLGIRQAWDLKLAEEKRGRWKDVRLVYPTVLAACNP